MDFVYQLDEILIQQFGYLDAKDLLSVCQVCKRLNVLCSSDAVWTEYKNAFPPQFPSSKSYKNIFLSGIYFEGNIQIKDKTTPLKIFRFKLLNATREIAEVNNVPYIIIFSHINDKCIKPITYATSNLCLEFLNSVMIAPEYSIYEINHVNIILEPDLACINMFNNYVVIKVLCESFPTWEQFNIINFQLNGVPNITSCTEIKYIKRSFAHLIYVLLADIYKDLKINIWIESMIQNALL